MIALTCPTVRFQKSRYLTLLPTNCLSVFDHFVGLALNGLRTENLKKLKHKSINN